MKENKQTERSVGQHNDDGSDPELAGLGRREFLRACALTAAALTVGRAIKGVKQGASADAHTGSASIDAGSDTASGALVWNPSVTEIVIAIGGTYNLNWMCSNSDGDPPIYGLDGSSVALPAGVTLDPATGILTVSDSALEGSTSGIVFVADDGKQAS